MNLNRWHWWATVIGVLFLTAEGLPTQFNCIVDGIGVALLALVVWYIIDRIELIVKLLAAIHKIEVKEE